MTENRDLKYEKFIKDFLALSSLDLNYYKENQMKRRINTFMNTHDSPNDYNGFLRKLKQDTQLFDKFFKHLTINVTQFYRDIKLWDVFKDKILPEIIKNKSSLKLWSAGCSAGQEPYTMAAIMKDHYPYTKYSILASDIDINVLKQAESGLYNERDFTSTPQRVVEKYFTKTDNNYQIDSKLKLNITFKKQNLLTDRFDTGFDFIACRNVVIYFTDDAKNILYKKFANSLSPGGILFTGSTEHLFGKTDLGLKSTSSFFYQKQ
ncbi:MAG: protein-glutamate O-methyltransferase CheR [Eubacteriales bacterium]